MTGIGGLFYQSEPSPAMREYLRKREERKKAVGAARKKVKENPDTDDLLARILVLEDKVAGLQGDSMARALSNSGR